MLAGSVPGCGCDTATGGSGWTPVWPGQHPAAMVVMMAMLRGSARLCSVPRVPRVPRIFQRGRGVACDVLCSGGAGVAVGMCSVPRVPPVPRIFQRGGGYCTLAAPMRRSSSRCPFGLRGRRSAARIEARASITPSPLGQPTGAAVCLLGVHGDSPPGSLWQGLFSRGSVVRRFQQTPCFFHVPGTGRRWSAAGHLMGAFRPARPATRCAGESIRREHSRHRV